MKARHIIIAVGLIAIIVLLIFITTSNKKAKYNWQNEFRVEKEDVYGIEIMMRMFEQVEGRSFTKVDSRLGSFFEDKADLQEASNYVFIGPALFLDTLDVNALLEFVEKGNNAFVSSRIISSKLMDELYVLCNDGWEWYDYSYDYMDSIRLNLNDRSLKQDSSTYLFSMKRDSTLKYRNWSFIADSLTCEEDTGLWPMGYIDDEMINYVKRSYGEGTFYLHTTPMAFTNLHLLKDQNVAYVNAVFSNFSEGNIYWDDFNRISLEAGRRMNNRRNISSEGPLKYILQQEAFAWAWYLLLALSLLYVIFGSKRTQRVIPVLEKNSNSSLEFISTIGTMYFNQNDHKKLCEEQMKLFLADLRGKYRVNTNLPENELIIRLAQKTEVPQDLIKKIFLYHKNISQSDFVSENTMIEFYQLLNQFTKTASIKNYAL